MKVRVSLKREHEQRTGGDLGLPIPTPTTGTETRTHKNQHPLGLAHSHHPMILIVPLLWNWKELEQEDEEAAFLLFSIAHLKIPSSVFQIANRKPAGLSTIKLTAPFDTPSPSSRLFSKTSGWRRLGR
jgi:hypothetical protein